MSGGGSSGTGHASGVSLEGGSGEGSSGLPSGVSLEPSGVSLEPTGASVAFFAAVVDAGGGVSPQADAGGGVSPQAEAELLWPEGTHYEITWSGNLPRDQGGRWLLVGLNIDLGILLSVTEHWEPQAESFGENYTKKWSGEFFGPRGGRWVLMGVNMVLRDGVPTVTEMWTRRD